MKSYIAIHKNNDVRMKSRSGGVFTAFTDGLLDNGAVVYGAEMTENMQVVHKRASCKTERDAFRGSKYVVSRVNEAIVQAKEDLQNGLTVLFSGTPCQIAAVKNQCKGIESGNLICIDIVCHGAPKKECFDKYKDFVEKKYGGKLEAIDFRNKLKFGWESHIETITVNGKQHNGRLFTDLFYQHLFFPKSCFSCRFKKLDRVGDITIGDAWGYSNGNFEKQKGVSLVLVNTEKGERLFENSKNDIIFYPCDISQYMQPPLMKNYPLPEKYDMFWKDFDSLTYDELYKKYSTTPFYVKILRKIKYAMKG